MPPIPVPEDRSSIDLVTTALRRAPVHAVANAGHGLGGLVKGVAGVVRHPAESVDGARRLAGSVRRVMGPPPAPPSPLLRRRGLGRRLEVLDVPLDRLRAAAGAAGASVNDAYIAALCGALRRYHEDLGVPVTAVPLAMPVNLRTDDDPAGGNRFGGARLAAPVGEVDPLERMRQIRELVLTAVDEPAMDALEPLAPAMSHLPISVIDALASKTAGTDVNASNVRGYPETPYIAGAEIVKSYWFGPLTGVAMMGLLMSQAGTCFVGVHYDTASVTDGELFARCLREGFDEVLAAAPSTASSQQEGARREVVGQGAGGMSAQLRLPGSVAEVAASPEGPEVGAFFDFDGTLIAGYSAGHLSRDRFRTRDVSIGELARTLGVAVNAGLGRAGFEDLLKIGAGAWKGRAHEDLEEMGERVFEQAIADVVYPEARSLVRAHLDRGHTVVLSSSATEYQVEPVARYLGIDRVLCNRYTQAATASSPASSNSRSSGERRRRPSCSRPPPSSGSTSPAATSTPTATRTWPSCTSSGTPGRRTRGSGWRRWPTRGGGRRCGSRAARRAASAPA